MKKILIPTLAVLLLLTGCRQTPKLENGKEKILIKKEEELQRMKIRQNSMIINKSIIYWQKSKLIF